jgi:hypothetical protein
MKSFPSVLGCSALAWAGSGLAVLLALALTGAQPAKSEETAVGQYRLSGPYAHDNLTVYLIHGEDRLKGKNVLTLQEAIEQKKVVVHETGNVSQLAVENVSAGDEVFIQGGDIVKGGQQDRVLTYDLLVPPKSGKVPLASFCVEAGRWRQRPGEAVERFNASTEALATKDLKLAARQAGSQDEVWKKVAVCQQLLSKNVGAPVQSGQSASSLQLTLENKKLLEVLEGYLKKLTPAPEGKGDVIGYAVAINGKVNCADVYASAALFKKLWPKLIKGSVVEAVVELQKDKKFEPAGAEAFKTFLLEAEKGKATAKEVSKRIQAVQKETPKYLLFETCDREQKGLPLRKSFIAK